MTLFPVQHRTTSIKAIAAQKARKQGSQAHNDHTRNWQPAGCHSRALDSSSDLVMDSLVPSARSADFMEQRHQRSEMGAPESMPRLTLSDWQTQWNERGGRVAARKEI
eukprot:scpid82319/ scgid24301/ 